MARYSIPINMEGHSLATVLLHTDTWEIPLTSLVIDNGNYLLDFASALPVEELEHLGLTEA